MKRSAGVAVVVALVALWATASAQANSATPMCNGGFCTGWFNGSVNLHWVLSPDPPDAQSGCDDATITTEGTTPRECDATWTDPPAANVPVDVQIDLHPPTLVPLLARPPDANGWYNHPVGLNLAGSTDALSGVNLATCDAPVYGGPGDPDTTSATLSGTCTDNAGNTASPATTAPFQYDATPPTIFSVGLARPPDQNGWYNHPVELQLQGNDATSGGVVCGTPSYNGPDGLGTLASGSCSDRAGNQAIGSIGLNYDGTAPEVGASADRKPDHDGWYNHPVTFAFKGEDGASSVASCTSTTYSGPSRGDASVAGSCTDFAGNTGTAVQPFKYDSTRPAAADIQITPGNHRVELTWTLPSDADEVLIARARQGGSSPAKLIYAGGHRSFLDKKLHNGAKYVYTVADIDQAGNSSAKTIRAIPTASSLRPFVGSVVSSPPMLTWKKVKRARYYNVQLYLGKKKVMSTWPRTPSLQLKQRWHYRGKTYTLVPGHYRWYVWPGFGQLSSHNYGDRIGRSSFRMR